MQKPTVGRIVHFKNGEDVQAALIVAVHSDTSINLVSWNAGGTATTYTSVSLGDGAHMWSWPPRA
jgi:surface antigen